MHQQFLWFTKHLMHRLQTRTIVSLHIRWILLILLGGARWPKAWSLVKELLLQDTMPNSILLLLLFFFFSEYCPRWQRNDNDENHSESAIPSLWFSPTIIHCSMPFAGELVVLLALAFREPDVWVSTDSEGESLPSAPFDNPYGQLRSSHCMNLYFCLSVMLFGPKSCHHVRMMVCKASTCYTRSWKLCRRDGSQCT